MLEGKSSKVMDDTKVNKFSDTVSSLAHLDSGFQVNLFQPGEVDYAHHITACPPEFENLTASLIKKGKERNIRLQDQELVLHFGGSEPRRNAALWANFDENVHKPPLWVNFINFELKWP